MVYDIRKNGKKMLERMIKTSDALLLVVYDSRKHEKKYIRLLTENIAPAFEPEIPVIRLDLGELDEHEAKAILDMLSVSSSSLPLLRLYYQGKPIWNQYGLFYRYAADREALRQGLWVSLEAWGLTPRQLGIKLVKMY